VISIRPSEAIPRSVKRRRRTIALIVVAVSLAAGVVIAFKSDLLPLDK
jgi:hypothetical protein